MFEAGNETSASVLTMDKIMDAMNRVPPCPWAQFMRERGCDPQDGWVLLMPVYARVWFSTEDPPDYVKISGYVSDPTLLHASDYRLNPLEEF